MAYAALTTLASVIDQFLPNEQLYISLCTKDQMKSLLEKISLLQDFLEYISLKTFLPDIDAFESRIRDTAYKMEDIIDQVILSNQRYLIGLIAYSVQRTAHYILRTPRWFNCNEEKFWSYFENFHDLLEETMEMKKNLDNNARPEKHPLTTTTLLRETPGSKGTRVGLDEPLKQILDQVIGRKSQLRIVPIIGMGGIGKTTLARASYEASGSVSHFDVRFWVTVSQDYDVQQILRGLLPEAAQDGERLIEYVHKRLTGRRYLIVLDDMWDEKVWDRVRNAFPDENNGSCIILTTRSSRVASYVGSSSPVHEMQFLNKDQSWDLLRVNVYENECCSPEFEDMGRMIARNCKGLPLAIVVIAGLLKFNKARDYWEQVARNTNEKVTTSNDHLFEILLWSYTRLPPHLKACFLYMGVYKEDYEIPTSELVMLLVAEGFLKPKLSRSMEEVAEECLEELAERSLVLVSKRRYNGKIKTLIVHDVIREVSIKKAEEEKFHYHFTSSVDESTFRNALATHRRVNFTGSYIYNFPIDTVCAATRSFIDLKEVNYVSIGNNVQSFKLLRVLLYRAEVDDVSQLSNILRTRTNLRYLNLYLTHDDDTIYIPNSVSELQNLETLIVTVVDKYGDIVDIVFPSEIWKLQRLRHIIVVYGGKIVLPVPTPNQDCLVLSNLQTLSGVRNINFTKSFVDRIPNLRKLKLVYAHDNQEYTMENLQYLHQLEELSIETDGFSVPTNYVFPQNLKKLSLFGTGIPWENPSPIGLLPNLKVLKLKEESVVMGEEWEVNEGEFVQLEHLQMSFLEISHWSVESIHFPCLRKLVIIDCFNLEEIPESIGEINTLETLMIVYGNENMKRSAQKIKDNQEDMENHLLQVIIR